jgi:hypothetical protein
LRVRMTWCFSSSAILLLLRAEGWRFTDAWAKTRPAGQNSLA